MVVLGFMGNKIAKVPVTICFCVGKYSSKILEMHGDYFFWNLPYNDTDKKVNQLSFFP